MVNLKDVAQAAGVSVATVSYVLRGAKPVSREVEARVWQAARELGYQPNRSAQTLRTGRSRTLGLLVPDLTNPYFPALVQAIETTGRSLGYALILIDAQNDPATEREGLELLAGYSVAGLVWVPVADPPGPLPYPAVLVDRSAEGFDVVQADHYQGGALLAAYALELGHRRIGLFSGPAELSSARSRRRGFLAGLKGLKPVWECSIPFALELPDSALAHLACNEVTLLVCANDVVAIGVLRALKQLGVMVPEEVSVLGFDDVPWAALLEPPLSTVRQPVAELGRTAVMLLHERIQAPEVSVKRQVLPVELIARRSAHRARDA
jgi:LacI family transcriptional regulator